MARRSPGRTASENQEERSVDRLAAHVVRLIKVVAIGLASTVTYLQFRNAPLEQIVETFDNSTLMKVGLFFFFIGWWWGATNDTEIQREGYCRDPKKGRLGIEEALGIVVFVAVFSLLFVLHNDPIWFQAALLVFIIVNMWTWSIIIRRTEPMIKASYEVFTSGGESRNNGSLLKLLLVVQYMNGPWQRRRFLTLIMLAALQLAVAVLIWTGLPGAWVAGLSVKDVPAPAILGYLPGTLFILYVVVSEVWMKIYRIKIFSDLQTIDYLEDHFSVIKRRDAALPQPHLAALMDFRASGNAAYTGHGMLDWVIDIS